MLVRLYFEQLFLNRVLKWSLQMVLSLGKGMLDCKSPTNLCKKEHTFILIVSEMLIYFFSVPKLILCQILFE